MASGKENIARNVSNYMQIFDINQVQLAEALNCSNTRRFRGIKSEAQV